MSSMTLEPKNPFFNDPMPSSSTGTHLGENHPSPPDLTHMLNDKHIVGKGSFSVVYRCKLQGHGVEVVVKAIALPDEFDQNEKDEFVRKVKRELGIWRRLNHPNIVPLLGTASGKDFGSDYGCIVSTFMENKTLFDYMKRCATALSVSDRVELIKGATAGLEYLHSEGVVHGDFHPANIMIDGSCQPRLTDFGLSQTFCLMPEQLAYLYTRSTRPGAVPWAAPELVYPKLYDLEFRATLQSDIYSLGSIIFYILSGRFPWKNRAEADDRLKEFKSPLRPAWPVVIPDGVWEFIERCWSPKDPRSRPSAQDVLSFCTDKLKELLLPNPANIVLFGITGSGKSSVINLLTGKSVVPASSVQTLCAERPRSYPICINKMQTQLWDTMVFTRVHEGSTSNLLPFEHAHAVLRNLPDPANLILLCVDKDAISPSLGHLYWFINQFFYGGRAPIALVVTHFDTCAPSEEWWECNKEDIAKRTSIPVDSIPHACVTTDPTVSDQSMKSVLEGLLQTRATACVPIPLRPDFSSYTEASADLVARCGLQEAEANTLVEKFKNPLRPFNIVFFGESGAQMTSIIDLITGGPKPKTNPWSGTGTLGSRFCRISTFDTMGASGRDVVNGVLENACQLIHSLSDEGASVDLLVFCKRFGDVTEKESTGYKLFKEILCKGKSPVAIVITHFESQCPAEKWWKTDGNKLLKTLGGDVIGRACVPPLATCDRDQRLLADSSLSIQTMMERCVQDSWASQGASFRKILRLFQNPEVQAVKNLMQHYGLTKEQAEKITQQCQQPNGLSRET